MADRESRQSLAEIQRRLAEQLSDAGVSGQLEVVHGRLVLELASGRRETPLDALSERWPSLSDSERSHALSQLQHRLVPGPRTRSALKRQSWLALAAVILVTASLSVALIRGIWQSGTQPVASKPVPSVANVAAARARAACEATRSRVMRGDTVGPADAEGWVFELRLLRPVAAANLQKTPGLDQFLTFEPPNSNSAVLNGSGAPAGSRVSISESRAGTLRDTRLEFSGRAVRSYFDAAARIDWVRFASALARHSGSEHAALFARCTHLTSHHVGAWFESNDPAGAASNLLYFMGAFVDSPQLLQNVLRPGGAASPADELIQLFERRAGDLEKAELVAWLSDDGGMVAGSPAGPISIRFPFKDSNRASRASLRLARRLGLAVQR